MRLQIQVTQVSFLKKLSDFFLRGRIRSLVIQAGFTVELILQCAEGAWVVLQTSISYQEQAPVDPRHPREIIIFSARLGMPLDKVEGVAPEREIWASLLRLLPS